VIRSIFYLLDLRVFFCFLFRFFLLFLPPDDGNLFIGAATAVDTEGAGGAVGAVGTEGAEGSATATGIASWPEAACAFENGLRVFSFSMVPESDGSSISGMDGNIDEDCDSGATLKPESTNVGGNIISFVVSAIVAYVKTNEVTPMKTYDNIGMWSVFILKL
jgi:hypothetical protein